MQQLVKNNTNQSEHCLIRGRGNPISEHKRYADNVIGDRCVSHTFLMYHIANFKWENNSNALISNTGYHRHNFRNSH